MELELKDITVNLGGKKILDSINLKVEKGELISLIGSSGCGKSTMLKTIAGIIKQDEGSILLGGKSADGVPSHKRKTVIVFQDFRLFPHMTVAENIGFPLKMMGVSKTEARKKSIELLKKVKLDGYEDRSVKEMSGGQIQRVALARALAADPVVLLLDEPFSSLDINLRKDMRELVLSLQREFKITTILVTHDQEEALSMSDKIAFMDQGKIQQYDRPELIFKYPANRIVADYFSEGSYIDGLVENNLFKNDLFTTKVHLKNGHYKCLIRPRAIDLSLDPTGNFLVIDKIYKGDYYLLKLKEINQEFYLESIIDQSKEIEIDHRVNIKLNKEKLIFISE